MNEVQKYQLRQSELRAEVADLLKLPVEEREQGKQERLNVELRQLETDLQSALLMQDERIGEDKESTAEGREETELRSRVQFSRFVEAALVGGTIRDGAEAEYNQHRGIREGYFPLDLLAGSAPVETRAKRDGDGMTSQSTWLDRVFAESAAMRLGVSMRSVSPGVASFPVTTAGGGGVQRGRTEAVTESTYSVTVGELKPTRAAVHGIYTVEDDARLPGLADAIERDMRAGMVEAIDRKIFTGDAGANENSADITGLQTAGIGESTLSQSNKAKAVNTLAVFTAWVDGIYSAGLDDMNVVATVGANTLWTSTIANASAENQTLAQFLRASGLMWGVRGSIETNTANGDFGAFVGLPRGIEGAAVAAVWESGQLVRDIYSGATKGEVELTLNYLWNFGVQRAANFKRLKFTG